MAAEFLFVCAGCSHPFATSPAPPEAARIIANKHSVSHLPYMVAGMVSGDPSVVDISIVDHLL